MWAESQLSDKIRTVSFHLYVNFGISFELSNKEEKINNQFKRDDINVSSMSTIW